jgi:hypothetical protein
MRRKQKLLIWLSLATLLGMGGIGWAVVYWIKPDDWTYLFLQTPIHIQLIWGTAYGTLISLLGIILIRHPIFSEAEQGFKKMIREIKPGFIEIVWYSLCAAIGEELLFRGATQYYFGIWPTAILFVALHGYIDPREKSMLLFSIFLVMAVAGFGYLCLGYGIVSAMAAHFVYDVVMFQFLRKKSG